MSTLASSVSTDLRAEPYGDTALLHLLDGYYIKRHTVNPWNTTGGYCDVFTGDHPTFGKVALKRPRGDKCTESQLRNFRQEAKIWRELRHPNILQFVGMIDTASHIWLISVFAKYGTLHEYISRYPEADRYSLALQFTYGLTYLHSKNVVHGDLKSSNLLISANHELLIADFGLSKFKGTATNTSRKGAGSVRWMAPELLDEEDATKTFSTDAYAYGITISEILRGELPFVRYANDFALMKAMAVRPVRPPTTPRESLQGKSYVILWAIAEECWDPEPSKRPSMVEVRDRIALDYTRTDDDSMLCCTCGVHANAANQINLAELAIASLDYNITSDQQRATRVAPSSNTSDTRLLQLLGNAEYGDTGHMLEDGLCLDGTRSKFSRN